MLNKSRLLSAITRILILLLLSVATFSAAQNNNSTSLCAPSSCGNNRNIAFPFRLKTDPKSCGYDDPDFELDCQNNRTILSVRSRSYYVQEINYSNYSIRLVNPGINGANLSSCPAYSDGYDVYWPLDKFVKLDHGNVEVAFVHCLAPASSLQYVRAAFCGNRDSYFLNSSGIFSYVIPGERILVSDLDETCVVDKLSLASTRKPVRGNSSLASIYDALAYGFELSWYRVFCEKCGSHRLCSLKGNMIVCGPEVLCSYNGKELSCTNPCFSSSFLESFKCRFPDYLGFIVAIYFLFMLALRLLCGYPFLVGLVVYKSRGRHLAMDETIEDFLESQNNLTPIKYGYSEIKRMTNNFNQKLGEGGYGTVYKGKLRSGPYVAVKIMGQSTASENDFISEVGTIGRIHHVNIVQLIGFCVEGPNYDLVYEFMPIGSLDRYIFNQQALGHLALRYDKMFEIALGVARGIDYLHRGCDMQILHFDIKPHNILLDENFGPKISDFGLAKLYSTDDSFINLTAARGTMGYMAPEMFYKNIGVVSYKADVYSYGMLLMEMTGRRKNMHPFADNESHIYFPSWVYDQFDAGKEIEIEDATEDERKMVKRVIIVALWCIQMNPSDRSPMNKVIEMLEGDSELPLPSRPFKGSTGDSRRSWNE